MPRRQRPHSGPPPSGKPSHPGPQITELRSQEELAGEPPLPLVELRPAGPPLEIIELHPSSDEPPPPFDRAAALAGLQAAFALLTDDEIQVARLRMLGAPSLDISEELAIRQELVEKLWKRARRKLGAALFKSE